MRYTIKHFRSQYGTDEQCLQFIFDERFGAGYVCKKCNKSGLYHPVVGRKSYACSCGAQVNPTAGTIFHKSETKLTDWFFAIFLMSQSRNGVAAKEIERHVGVTYKTAWRMCKQIRLLMSQSPSMLSGVVEADGTYIGGKRRMKHKMENKSAIVGLVERKGSVLARKVDAEDTYTLLPLVRKNVAIGSFIFSDEHPTYKKLPQFGYSHDYITHSKDQYVHGEVHTNTIEGFWSQVKRSISGTHHAVSPKYLQMYLDEFVFRYNHRLDPIFPVLLALVVEPPVSTVP